MNNTTTHLKDWLIKTNDGHIYGPFTETQIIEKIQSGHYTGDYLVAEALILKWIRLDRSKNFHKIFFQMSAKSAEQNTNKKQTSKDLIYSLSEDLPNLKEPKQNRTKNKSKFQKPKKLANKSKKRKKQINKPPQKPNKKNNNLAIILLFILALIFISYENWPTQKHTASTGLFHLRAPDFSKKTPYNKEEFKKLYSLSVSNFRQDSFSQYVQTQNYLIKAIEMKPREKSLYSFLCLTYLELWPYTYRSFENEETFFKVFKQIYQLDPGGLEASTCEIARLITKNLYLEASKKVITALNIRKKAKFNLYYLQALILLHFKKYNRSLSYLNSSNSLQSSWVKIFALKAFVLEKQLKYSQAMRIYKNIVNKYPSHKFSLIRLGIIEYKVFSHYKNAENLLNRAINISTNIDFIVLSEAYLTLYKLAIKKSDKVKALSYIRQAYIFNPAEKAIKALYDNMGEVHSLQHSGVQSYQLVLRGDQFYQNKQYNLAQTYYKSAFVQDAKNATTAYKVAKTFWELGFAKEAIAWLEKTIKIKPKFIHAYILLSKYYIHRYQYVTAEKILRSAHKQNPRAYEIYYAYANLEFKKSNTIQAIAFAKKALKLYPYDKDSLVILAKSYFVQKKIDQALNISEQILDLHPYYNPAQEIYIHSLAEMRGISAALSYINTFINNYPKSSFYYFLKAEILAKHNRYSQAKVNFYKAIKLNPNFKRAYLDLAKVNIKNQQLQEAEDLLITVALSNPLDPESLFALSQLYLERKKYKKAIKKLFSILNINKNYPLINFYIGKIYYLNSNFKLAKKHLKLEKINNPNLADPSIVLAEIYLSKKKYLSCIQEYQIAVKIRGASANIYIKMAKCYRLKGSLDTAKIMLERARKIESGLPEIYKELGAIYESNGKIRLATQAYKQYFLLKPNAKDGPEIKKRLGL